MSSISASAAVPCRYSSPRALVLDGGAYPSTLACAGEAVASATPRSRPAEDADERISRRLEVAASSVLLKVAHLAFLLGALFARNASEWLISSARAVRTGAFLIVFLCVL